MERFIHAGVGLDRQVFIVRKETLLEKTFNLNRPLKIKGLRK